MRGLRVVMSAVLLLGLISVITTQSAAFADVPEFGMTPEATQEVLEEGERVESQLTDPKAAEELPHRNLDRAQVLQLISSVFGTQIEGVAGVFGDLNISHFLSDNAAVIDAGDQPDAAGVVVGDNHYEGPALLESTVPLRTEDQTGEEATVDLGLEHTEGEIQATTPLVEIGIPAELGEGIELPESEVSIALAGAPEERVPSIVDQTVAVYPEVAEDTSLAVAPSPTGVETFTLLQSPDAPNSTTYQLSLPEGTDLTASSDGGAEVSTGDQPMLRVFPPAAMDAEGNNVPVNLEVSGDSFTVHADPPDEAVYPILVDPVVESHNWYGYQNPDGLQAWQGSSNDQGLLYNKQSALGYPGTDLRAVKGFGLAYNAKAHWAYSVPRFESDQKTFGTLPTSYISSMVLTNLFFVTKDTSLYPMMAAGIWDPTVSNWATAWGHGGNTGNLENLATTYTFTTTNQSAKQAIDNELWAGEAHTMSSDRETYVGNATVELADKLAPKIGSFVPPEKWIGPTPPGIPFSMTDTGLGISQIVTEETSGGKRITTNQGCIGTVTSPCPRTWSENGQTSSLKVLASDLTQGTHKMKAFAKDPVGNQSEPYEFTVKVDRTAPAMTLSGTMLSPYPQRPRFTLKLAATDGSEVAPQSGIASTQISVDGKTVDSTSAGCPTQNCSVTREWVLNSSEFPVGKHTIVVKATDGVGLTTEKTLPLTIERDTTAPTITTFNGSLADGPSGWLEQKVAFLYVRGDDNYGSGVTSIELKIDGKTVSSLNAPCPDGFCQPMLSAEVDLSKYKGGTHHAEVIVKDGAGNMVSKAWDIHVNPTGSISATEAIDTIEAVEETSDATPIAPTADLIDPEERADGNDPGLEEVEGGFASTGTPLDSQLSSDPSEGVTLEAPDGDIQVTEVGAASGSPPSVASDVASVDPNTATKVDSVVRPVYDGDQSFKIIRDTAAPTTYSWKVSLNAGQKLEQVDPQHVAVFYSNGDRALLISAEEAHDATGKEVPTELTAEGTDIIVLTVKHTSASFVYPVLAGPAFSAGYTQPVIWEPPKEEWDWDAEEMYGTSGPLEFVPTKNPECEGACDSSLKGFYRRVFEAHMCSGLFIPVLGIGGCEVYNQHMDSFFNFNYRYAWWKKTQPAPYCHADTATNVDVTHGYCDWIGPDHQKYGGGYHISAQVQIHIVVTIGLAQQSHVKR